ncbi:MAG: transglutaminase domain-containing protein, partial [Planctomycetota bacterium]
MQTWSRKRREAVFLGVIAVLSITPMRWPIENRYLFLAEFLLVAIFAVVAGWKQSRAANYFAVAMTLVPVLFAFLARSFTTPVAFELTALTCFGTLSVAIALSAKTDRTRAMSLVVGGFLVLFCASISDERSAIVYPLLWMTGCVWHLVANHWERLDLAMPETVTSTWKLRPTTVAVALLLLGVVGYGLKDSFSDSGKLNLGIMPTSGGSAWSDPAARSGVGSGDAAIAAKDHAESFGAVDSDIFLESTESTLFDMVNDLLGEPVKKKNVWERRQAMHNENVIPMHSKAAKTEKGSGSFSTERMPPPKHRHFRDANSNAIMQWDGSTGTRLAMQRYDTFDGAEWTQTADIGRTQLLRRVIEDQHWFFDPESWNRMQRESDSVSVSLLKVLKLNSVRIPVPMQTCGLHIKEVDRIDFFGISKDGSMEMPGREKIPDLTVFHVASLL